MEAQKARGLRAVAIVEGPSAQLVEAARGAQAVECKGDGVLVVRLQLDAEASHHRTPHRWLPTLKANHRGGPIKQTYRDTLGDDKQPPDYVYKEPESLRDARYSVQLLGSEYGDGADFIQVVAAADGQPLAPFRVEETPRGRDWHIAAHFLASALSWVAVVKRRDGESGEYSITIGDGQIGIEDRQIIVRRRRLLWHYDVAAPALPAEYAAWQPALRGLYARIQCPDPRCGAHFAQ